jgi:hypothetical protein
MSRHSYIYLVPAVVEDLSELIFDRQGWNPRSRRWIAKPAVQTVSGDSYWKMLGP